jgi:hypothetical protein
MGHVSHVGEVENAYRNLVGKSEGDRLGETCVDGRLIIKWIFKK